MRPVPGNDEQMGGGDGGIATTEATGSSDRHAVVVGSGSGGLFATRRLAGAPVDVTLTDRTTHHLFHPLLYRVATGTLSEGDVAPTIRTFFAGSITCASRGARSSTSDSIGAS